VASSDVYDLSNRTLVFTEREKLTEELTISVSRWTFLS
jgi:DNA-binding XRE family transcriptional regulator